MGHEHASNLGWLRMAQPVRKKFRATTKPLVPKNGAGCASQELGMVLDVTFERLVDFPACCGKSESRY